MIRIKIAFIISLCALIANNTMLAMKRQNPYADQNIQPPQKSALHAYDPSKQQCCIEQKNNFVSEGFLSETESETEEETPSSSTPLQSDHSKKIKTISPSAQLISMGLYNPDIQTFTLQITKSPIKSKQAKKFPCHFENCTQSCTSLWNLEIHKRTHTGEKPFKCQFCPQTFTDKGNLTTHERRHTGKKPYKCNYCNQSFSASNNRNRHEQMHAGLKFFCPACDKSYFSQSSLKRHMREKHA